MSNPLYSFASRIYRLFEEKPGIKRTFILALFIVIAGLGTYIRIIPALNYGLELHANDPWIEYWQANYTYHHGLLSWYSLTRDNPDTHLFWYPWGRDFPTSSYPGLPIWTALTYPVAQLFSLSLKDWVALQPVVFAFFSFITLYLATKEVSRGNMYAVFAALILYAFIPSASDRNIIGFVEKEGIAITFLYLYIYFYSKMSKTLNSNEYGSIDKLKYTLLAGLSMAMVGWFWGGFIYLFGTVVAFLILYPLFDSKKITSEFIKYHLILIVSTIIFAIPSPSIMKSLGLIPFRYKSIGLVMIASIIFPIIFWLFHHNYRRIGLKKPLLKPTSYLGLLIVIIIAGLVLYSQGYISMSPRYAWALGLRAITPAPPLVQSVEEHQSPLSSPSMVFDMLHSWGVAQPALLLFSPLVLAILGALYLIYKGGMDQIYLSIAFLLAFYSYMNAAYMEATASSTGLLVAGIFFGYIISKILPSREDVMLWERGRVRVGTSNTVRLIALLITILVSVNIVYGGIDLYESHNRMIYTIMAGGTPISARNDAWYETLDFLRKNLSSDAVVVAWWDYGYWISVGSHRKTVADGATLNSSQIRILARILTSMNETELFELMRKLHLPANDTYILVYDVFWFIPDRTQPNGYIVMPYQPRGMVGLVDIPKSIWMIKIGGRDISKYFYLYSLTSGGTYISPRFDKPEELPLIYKMMVDGILALNKYKENKTFRFAWYTGNEGEIWGKYSYLKKALGITREVTVTLSMNGQPNMKILSYEDRPFKNTTWIQPYMVIAEPFEGLQTQGGTFIADVIFIYKVTIPQK